MASVSGASLALSVFPRDLWSSPYVFAGADFSSASGFLHSAGPQVSFGSCPVTSGASGSMLMLMPRLIRMIRNLLL